jgi:hypothetical protein
MHPMPRNPNRYTLPALLAALLFNTGCVIKVVDPAVPLQGTATTAAIPEDLLLDVGIRIFTPVAEPALADNTTLQNLRNAESHYLSWQLGQALQGSGNWGTIRLTPFMLNNADLMIDGEVLQSDGETLRVHVTARDARGRRWLDRDYYQLADADSYESAVGESPPLPFVSLLNQVANDLLEFRADNVSATELATIRRAASLDFAAEFAPDLYGDYSLDRMPPATDPVFVRIESIRNRNDLFLDALQDQYTVFARTVDEPYRQFLARSNVITAGINYSINAKTVARRYGATLPVAPERTTHNMSPMRYDFSTRRSNRLNYGKNSTLYAAALADAGQAFEMHVAPQTLEFSQHTVTLTGSVEEQFAQWREILQELHALDGL